jgi:hypothetical protein
VITLCKFSVPHTGSADESNVRDRQSAAVLGLPTRIRDEDCDIEMLEVSHFEEESHSVYPRYLGTPKKEHILYAIQMAKLDVYRWSPNFLHLWWAIDNHVVGKIVLREFAPIKGPRKESERTNLKEGLVKWEAELSSEMKASSTANYFWASMLHLAYK